jgi:multidrug efflux pump subunit AcrA (membrane-fusion protein)
MKLKQTATITTDAYPGRGFKSTIQRISKVLRESSRQARVELEVANDDLALRPGMFIRARVTFGRKDQAQAVPRNALIRFKGREGVFIVKDEQAGFVPVQTGIVEGDWVEITNPELPGPVVIMGQHLLSDGAKVSLSAPGKEQGGVEEDRGATGVEKKTAGRDGEQSDK